ncbi:calcium/sodium antiporter [Haloarcula marina]|uniref:calcium/sodium antiporter n=1 Tax=Haloarcula marina TaxID=2961574 RepID=UPI0020B7AEB3|nr:calcium/sodium antiporter [Halomicroarcula marina]
MAVFVVGVVLLYLGAELLVDGAASLALGYGMRATTVGVTVIAFATTAPELIVSTIGGLTESDGIALGNIIGSNVANIGLVLGMSAVAYPMHVDRSLVRKHGPFMMLAVVGLVVLSSDSLIGMVDGILLLGLLAVYMGYIIYRARRSDGAVLPDELSPEDEQTGSRLDIVKVIGAILCLLAGSRALIVGGQNVLHALGFGDLFVGLTVIAIGTSMPELATSLVSAYREGAAFSVGNVIGSNIYNILAVIGIVAVIVPIHVSGSTKTVELPLLVVFTVVVLALLGFRERVTRLEGAVLLGGYGVFIYLLLLARGF